MKRREFVGAGLPGALGAAGLGWAGLLQASAKTNMGGEIRPPDGKFLTALPKLMEIAQLPGIGIGVVQGGKITWRHYEGFANCGREDPRCGGIGFSRGVAWEASLCVSGAGDWWTRESWN